ncbi:hypothetical protein ACHAXR_007070 [Thalassiosira sp. AJA248-18]
MAEGVGKSSLVSTFVSRHFSGQVPGILTRVRLPPDPSLSKCTTTIIDTQDGDTTLSNALSFSGPNRGSLASIRSSDTDSISSLGKSHGGRDHAVVTPGLAAAKGAVSVEESSGNRRGSSLTSSSDKHESAAAILAATSPFRSVDAIILVYDLDRIETFRRLEHHWLPLIEQCYSGDLPIIVAGNKMDLASASGDQHSPSRQQIISLLQQFKYVRQCIKCSAKELLNVDEVFLKSQQSVLFPISPLYNLNTGQLTPACTRAFTRIFRMFDMDRDGLLSDAELNDLQQKVWGVPLTEKDFTGWKKMATQHDGGRGDGTENEYAIRDGKFTVAGFLGIFHVLITDQNRLEVPWRVLRTLGYDDELVLNIPASISPKIRDDYLHPDDWRLDIDFLTSIFLQFDSDGDGILSSADIHTIFSVLSIPHPPWDEHRSNLYQDCFSLPSVEDEETPPPSPGATPTSHLSSPSSFISASGVTISSSPLPSVEISKESESLCFATLPKHTPLTYLSWINRWHMINTISPSIARAEMYRLGHDLKIKSPQLAPHVPPVTAIPSTFIRALILGSQGSGKRALVQKLHRLPYSHDLIEAGYPETSCSVSRTLRPKSSSSTTRKGDEEMIVHVILTEVPALDMSSDTEQRNLRNKVAILLGQERSYDMAVLAFDANDLQSWQFAKDLEHNVLTEEMPRVFVGTTSEATKSGPEMSNTPIREAYEHCKCMDLEPPIIVSLCEETEKDSSVLERLVSCAQDERRVAVVSFRSTPHGERKRRYAARRRKVLWIGGLVTAGITVVLGLTSLTGKKKYVPERGGWLRFFRKMLS